MTTPLPPALHAVVDVFLDALTALDSADQDASTRAVPTALGALGDIPELRTDPELVLYGALMLTNTTLGLVSTTQGVDRLDIIAALRDLYGRQVGH